MSSSNKISTFGTQAALTSTPINKEKAFEKKESSDSNESVNDT